MRTNRVVLAAAAAAALAGAGIYVHRAARAPSAPPPAAVPRLVTTGQPADWTAAAKVVASVPGHVHCFSLLDRKTVRMIWGAPRHAEDVDVDSGERRPAPLLRETYATGCPDLSAGRGELLFSATTAAGAAEIRHSPNPEGRDARPVTPGWNPIWSKDGEEFVYSVDGAHAAVFSLATKKGRPVADPGLGVTQAILGTAVDKRSGAVAVMYYANDVQWVVAIHDGPALDRRAMFAIPGARSLRFAPADDTLFISPLDEPSPLTALDWRKGALRSVGRYAGMDLIDAQVSGPTAVVLARRRSKDAWLHEPSGKRRLTTDGDTDDAALSVNGDLLVARPGPGSTENIWARTPGGALRKVTNGQHDTSPDFSPDGRTWVYVDYDRRSIMTCASGAEPCRVLRHDDVLPVAPRFSPDGSKLAYLRLGATTRLLAFSPSTGKEWPLGSVYWQCPPVWSSPETIWAVEESSGSYAWVEKELETGLRTGRRLQVENNQGAADEDLDCWPRDVDAASPFFSRPRVETREASSLLGLPASHIAAR